MTVRQLVICAAACAALAAGSLALPGDPVYDAWAWLVWGRELASGQLDLGLGPSWKPLPVGVTALLSFAGDAAPELWLALVRTAWLFALVLAADLAYRLAADYRRRERLVAAGFAALSLLLLADPFDAWLSQAARGISEPLLVVLVLLAVRLGLDGRHRIALAIGLLAALLRPEVWPLLAVYGAWLWRNDRAARPLVLAVAVTIPALWLGPDLLTAGDGPGSAERARRGGDGALDALVEVLERAAQLPLLAAWPLAAFATARRDPRIRLLAVGALAWIAIVAVMAAAGFAGLPRFLAAAGAVLGVVGGVGLAGLVARVRERSSPRRALTVAALAAVLVSLAVQLPLRGTELREDARLTVRIAQRNERLADLMHAAGGRDVLLRCGRLATSDVLVRTRIAWELDVALDQVVSFGDVPKRSGAFIIGPRAPLWLRLSTASRAEPLAVRDEWRIYSLACPAAANASPAPSASASMRSAGVSGARR